MSGQLNGRERMCEQLNGSTPQFIIFFPQSLCLAECKQSINCIWIYLISLNSNVSVLDLADTPNFCLYLFKDIYTINLLFDVWWQ